MSGIFLCIISRIKLPNTRSESDIIIPTINASVYNAEMSR